MNSELKLEIMFFEQMKKLSTAMIRRAIKMFEAELARRGEYV